MTNLSAPGGGTERLFSVANMLNTDDMSKARTVLEQLEVINKRFAVVKSGSSVGVADLTSHPIDILAVTGFNTLYANKPVFIETERGERKTTLSAFWLEWKYRSEYDGGIVFAPNQEAPRNKLNLFTGFETQPGGGSWDTMERHLREVVCARDEKHFEWLMSWMADIVQNPGQKPGTAVCLRGKKGTGKSIVWEMFSKLLGHKYAATICNSEHLTGRFNKHLQTALFCQVEEAVWAGNKSAESQLKSMITQPRLRVEAKNVDSYEVENFTRFGFSTNEDWALPASSDERRWFIIDVSEDRMQDTEYFNAIFMQMEHAGGLSAWMRALLDWNKPDWVDLRNPPKTDALAEQVLESLPASDLFFVEATREGTYFHEDERDFVRADDLFEAYTEFLKQRGAKYAITQKKFGKALARVWGEDRRDRMYINGKKTSVYWVEPMEEMREIVAENLKIPVDMLQ